MSEWTQPASCCFWHHNYKIQEKYENSSRSEAKVKCHHNLVSSRAHHDTWLYQVASIRNEQFLDS